MKDGIFEVGDKVTWPKGNAGAPGINTGVVVKVYRRGHGGVPYEDACRLFPDCRIRFSTNTRRGGHKAWYLVRGAPCPREAKDQIFFPPVKRLQLVSEN